MPTTSVTREDRLLVTTSMLAAKEVRDGDYNAIPILEDHDKLHGKGKPSEDGGDQWSYGIQVGDHSVSTRARTGYEQMNLSVNSTEQPIIYQPAAVQSPAVIAELEEDINNGRRKLHDIGQLRTRKVMARARREWDRQMIAGGVSMFDDFNTLNGIDYPTKGFLINSPAGSQAQTIGGFNRGTYASSPGTQHQHYDMAGSANAALLRAMWTVVVKAKNRCEDLNKLRWYFSESGYVHYKAILQPQERYVHSGKDGVTLDAGSMRLQYEGVPLCPHLHMPVAGTNTATDPMTFALVDWGSIRFVWLRAKRDGYFGFFPWKDVGNGYNVKLAYVFTAGQLVGDHWSGSAVGIDGETF